MSTAVAAMPAVEKNERLANLFVAHYRRVLLAGYRITGNMADAEDVAQAVFMRLGKADLPEVANAASYLYRAAINGALDLLRRRKTAAAEPIEAAAEIASRHSSALPDEWVRNLELGRLLRQAIGELAPRAAEMFALRYLEERSNGEIAKLIGTSQAVVAVTLYQSRMKLRRRLAELERGMG